MATRKFPQPRNVIEVSSDDEDGGNDKEGEFEVEEILQSRWKLGRKEYFLKWKGYGDVHNSWEPAKNLNCPDKIAAFEKKHNPIRSARQKYSSSTPKTSRKSSSTDAVGKSRKSRSTTVAEGSQKSSSNDNGSEKTRGQRTRSTVNGPETSRTSPSTNNATERNQRSPTPEFALGKRGFFQRKQYIEEQRRKKRKARKSRSEDND